MEELLSCLGEICDFSMSLHSHVTIPPLNESEENPNNRTMESPPLFLFGIDSCDHNRENRRSSLLANTVTGNTPSRATAECRCR